MSFAASTRRAIALFAFTILTIATAAVADPYPPVWGGGATHFSPAPWPADALYVAATKSNDSIEDPRTLDPSHGGARPQNYVNISSSCTGLSPDQQLPSIAYYYDAATQTIFYRWRVEQIANTYGTGPAPGAYQNTDPWKAAQWTILFDTNGDGFRDFAAHLHGSSGTPTTPIDRIVTVWSNTKSNSIDYEADPAIKVLFHNPTAFVDNGTQQILNFSPGGVPTIISPSPNWPNGANETIWNYGTTMARNISAPGVCEEYFIYYQVPLAMLDATAFGGPKVLPGTPVRMIFSTANSGTDPFQKDVNLEGSFTCGPYGSAPFGDVVGFGSGTVQQPTITSVTATSCPVELVTQVFDDVNVVNCTAVQTVDTSSVRFYYWFDSNGDGVANDSGSSWTLAATGTASATTVGRFTATWNPSVLPNGKYLIAVRASDTQGNITWSHTTPGAVGANATNPAGTIIASVLNTCGTSPVVTKSADILTPSVGQAVRFTLTINNPAGSPAITLTSIQDTLPPGFTFNSTPAVTTPPLPITFSASPANGSTGTLDWTLSTPVTIFGGGTFYLSFTANAGTQLGTFVNKGRMVASSMTIPSNEVQLKVGAPQLTVRKTASVASQSPGGTVTWTITYSNDTGVDATNVVITDDLNAASMSGLTYVPASASAGGVFAGGVITWNIGTVNAFTGPFSVTFQTTVNNPYTPTSRERINTAVIDSNETAPLSTTAKLAINIPSPSLVVQKSADKSLVDAAAVAPNNRVTYTITYANTGGANATGTTLTDALPAGTTFVSATGAPTTAPAAGANGTVLWTLGTLAPGASGSVTVTVTVTTGTANPFDNTASLDCNELPPVTDTYRVTRIEPACSVSTTYYFRGTQVDVGNTGGAATLPMPPLPDPSNPGAAVGGVKYVATTGTAPAGPLVVNPALANAAQQVFQAGAELGQFYTDPISAGAYSFSGNITGTIYVDKTGAPQGIATLLVYDYNPATGGVTLIASGDASSGGITGNPTNSAVTFSLTPAAGSVLVEGHRLLFIVRMRANHASQDNLVRIRWNDAASPSQVGICLTPVRLIVDKTVDRVTVGQGGNLTYTIAYANGSPVALSGVTLADTLPTGTTFVSASGPTSSTPVVGAAGTVNWTIGALAASTSGSVTVTVKVDDPFTAANPIVNTATLDSNETGPASDTASSTVIPTLLISKSVDDSSLIPGQSPVTYTITVSNPSSTPASGVRITDAGPTPSVAWFTLVNAVNAGWTCTPAVPTGFPLDCTMTSALAGNASATFTYTMAVGSAAVVPDGTTFLTNTAFVRDTINTTPRPSNPVTVAVTDNTPRLTLSKATSPVGTVAQGSTLTYTLTLVSNGTGAATDVELTDPIPANTSYANGAINVTGGGSAAYDPLRNRIVYTNASLASGTTVTVSFPVVVGTTVANATLITNTATVTASNHRTLTATASNTVSGTPAPPVLTLTKTAITPVVLPLARLTLAAAGVNTVTVDTNTTSQITIGDTVSIDNVVYTVLAVTSSTLTLNAPVSAPAGTAIAPVSDPAVGLVPFPLARLAANASATTTITVDRTSNLTIGRPVVINGTLATVTDIPSSTTATLSTAVTGTAGTRVEPTIEYVMNYANTGTVAATGVFIQDSLPTSPASLIFISATAPAGVIVTNPTANTVLFTFTSPLPAGEGGQVRILARLDPAAAAPLPAGRYTNTALIDSNETTPVTATAVTQVGTLEPYKTTSTPNVAPGGVASYTITVTNNSSVTATSLKVTDQLGTHFTYAATGTATGTPANPPAPIVDATIPSRPTWTWGTGTINLPPGGTITIPFTANVSANAPSDTFQNEVASLNPDVPSFSFDFLATPDEDVSVCGGSVAISGTATFCGSSGGSTTLTATVTGGGPTPFKYEWFRNGISLGTQSSSNTLIVTLAGSYTVRARGNDGLGCALNSTATVVTDSSPATPSASNNGPICSGGTATLSTPTVAGATYSWTGPGGFTSSAQNPTTTVAGTYFVTVTVGGCSSSAGSTTVVVNPTPATPSASNNGPICAGGSATLSTPAVAGATYAWTGPNAFTSNAQNPTATDAGTYFVTITVNGCPSPAGSTTLVTNPTPATPTASNDGPVCTGGTATLSTPVVAGATYAWTGPNGFTSSAQNPTATDAGTYFVTVTVNGCTSPAGSTTLVVNATPATPTTSNDGPICNGGTANLSTPAVAGATYAWTGPNGFTSSAQNPTATDAGTYFVTVTVNGCTSPAGSTTLVVNPTPATPTASNDGPICTGGTANLSTPAVAGATYAWTGPNGFTSSAQNPTATDAGTYFVTVMANGCTSPAGSTTLVVNATPATPTASNDGPICTGGTANLSTPAVAGATYAWTGPNGFTSSVQNPTAADAGTYFVTITVNGCTSPAGSTTLVVNPTPATPTASNDGPICTGGTANLSTPAVAGATYAWTGPNGFTSSAQNPTATDAGTYFVTVTVNGCTSASGSTTLVVNATPVTPTASNDGPICSGGTANLSTPAVAGATYAWTGPNGFTSSAQNPTATDVGTYFVTVTVNGCTSPAGSTTLVVNPTPATPTASNDGPICTGGTANLSTPAVAGATYAWTGPNGFTSNAQNPTATDAGTYFVAITVNGCTSVAGSTTVVVNPTPATPTASNDGPICTGGTANLSTPAVAGATYAWTGPNGFTSNAQNPTATDAGTYFVTVTVNGCTSPAGSTTLVVNAIPATPTASNDGPVCAGGTANLSTPAVAGATYAWTGPSGFTSNAQNPTATDAGTYFVTVTVNGCTSPAGSTTLVVNAIPATPTASNDGPICAGGTANLSTPAVAGATYAWTGPNGFTSNAQNPTATDAGTYFVTVTVNGCTSPAGSTTLVVNAIPATPTASNDGPICAGGTANLSTPAVAGATYAWTGPNGFTSNAQNPTATDAGTYFVTVTVNGCTSPAGSTTLIVNAIPATPTASNDGPVCAGGTATLSTPAVAGATYAWTGPNGFTSNAQNPTATDAGTYFVTVTVNGCTSPAGSTTLVVNPIPSTPTASNDGPICAGGTANLSTPAVAGATYAWTGPNGFTSNAQNPTATDAGTYFVTVTVNGCTSPAGSTTLVVNAIPATPTASNDGPICAGGTANLSTPAVAGATYAWTGPNGFTSNAQNPTATDAGTYFVTVTVNGCTSPAGSTTLVVNAIPSTPTASNDGPVCAGGTANLSTPAVAGATYAWTGPNGFTSNAQNPTATDAGTYFVTVTVNGCTSPAGSTTLVVNAIPATPTASNDGPICAGGTANLSTPAVAGATYAWTGPNGFTSNAQNPTATDAGTYNVTVTVNGCTSPAGSTTLVVNAIPATPTASNDGPICAGGTANLSTPAVAGATYAWTGPNGFTSNAQIPTATDAGTYNVTVTVNGCTSPAGSTTLVVNAIPATPTASNDGPVCAGGTANLSTPAVAGATYAWTGPNGFTSNAQNPTATDAGTYFVTVTVNGCTSPAGSTTLVVNAIPATPAASNDGPICSGGTANLSTPAVPGATYAWTGPNGYTSNAQNPTATDAGTYFVTVTVNGCTSPAGSTTLVVNAIPATPTASNDGPVCAGGTANLSTPAVAGGTYAWTGPNGFTSNAQNPTATDAGTYFVNITVNGCTSPAGSTTLVVNAIPATPTASNDGPVCAGGTANLSTPAVAGATYAWTGPNGFTSNGQNPTATDAGTYNVTVTVNGCTSPAGSTTLVVNAIPATPSASNDGPVCAGGTANLSTPAVAGATYAWTGPNGFTSNAQNPTATDAGTYNVTVTVNGCTSPAGSTTLVVNAIPSTPTATNDGPICVGGTANLSTPAVAGATYAWTGPNGFTSNAQNPTATDAGTYNVTVTVNGCTSPAGSTTLVVNAIPAAPAASNDGPTCAGGTVNLSTPAVAGATYAWTGPNGFTSSAQNPTATEAGTYNVTVTVNGCTSPAGSTTVVVNATPAAPIASNDGPACAGGTVNLSTPTVAGATYAWTGPNGFTSNAQNPTATDAGTYSVTVTVNGCTSAPGSTNVVINPLPATPTASSSGPSCGPITLNTPAVAGATYAWTGPNAFTSSQQNPVVNVGGTYSVTVTVNGCTSAPGSTNVTVTPTESPVANNGGPFCANLPVTLTATSVAGATYQWSGPNGFSSTEQNPVIPNGAAGVYEVRAIVNGCPSAPAQTTVVIKAPLPPPVASNSGPYCPGQNVALSVSSTPGATFVWSGPNGFFSTEQNPTISSASADTAGVYSVVATVGGCAAPAATTTINMSGSCAPRPPVDLVLNKSVDTPNANEGDTITFTISAENLGAGTATGVVIRDVLPAGLTFVSATPSSGAYDSPSGNWLIPTLNENATATLQLRASVNAGQALQTLTNCASLQTSTPGDVNAANNEACAPVDALPPDLEIVKTSDVAVPQVGDIVTYTITATNHGPGTAAFTDVRITDVLPAAVDLLSSNASQGSWSLTTGLWNAGSIASGATATLTITTRVNALGATMRARNCASLALSTPPDLIAANNTSCAPVDLAVTKTVDQPVVREGDRIRYRVTITNNGPTRATNVDVSTQQITGLTFVGATPSQGGYTGGGDGNWDIGVLEVGETVTLDIFLTVNPGTSGTTITNCANLSGSSPNDGDPSNDSGCATFTVIADQPPPAPLPDLSVTKTADATSLNEGSTFRYTIVVTNHGAGAAEGVAVTDRIPVGLQLNAVQPSIGTYDANSGIWSIGDLAEGASATLRITVTANSGTANTTITNCATVATPNANSLNDQACAAVQVVTPSAACGNNPPLLSIPLLQNVERGKRIEFRVAAIDPDGDPVSLAANGLPGNARFDAATGVLTFEPNDLCDVEDMLYTPTFVAIDGRGGITTAPVAITVVDRDALRRRAAAAPGDTIRTPILAIPQAPVRVNRPAVLTFKVTATAQENDCATAVVLTTPELGTFNTTTGLFTYQPNDVIARQIRLAGFRATDCRGRVAFANVPIHTGESTSIANALISTSRVRFAPALVGGERRATVVSVTNRGNAPLRVSSLRLESGESFRVEGVAVLPVVIQPSHTVDLDVVFEPSRAGRVSDRLLIESNDAVEPVAAIELEGNAVAAESIPVMNAEAPATSATRAYAGTTSILPLGPSVGVNAVCGNREPMLSVPPLVVAEIGKTLRFRVAAIDPDDDAVSIGVAQLPAGANIDPATGEFTFTPNDACEDEVDRVYDVTFIATDARGASVSVPVQITTVDSATESATRRPLVSVPRESLRVTRGETLRFRIAARAQTNGCAATMSRLPNVGRYDATTGDYVVTPSVDSPVGSLLLPFEARDCDGRTTLATVRVEVVDGAVRAGGRARVPVESLEFTSTPSRSVNGYAVVTIANDGDQPLRISRVSLATGTAFRIDGTAGLPVMVRPGQVLPVRIVFEPGAATGEITDSLVIETSDAIAPTTRVQLKGVGR